MCSSDARTGAAAPVRGWASYTWGRATTKQYGRSIHSRTPPACVIIGRVLPASERWEVAATTRVATGFPRTPPVGLRVASEPDALDRDDDGNLDELVPAVDAAGCAIYAVDFGGLANLEHGAAPSVCAGRPARHLEAARPAGRMELLRRSSTC